MTDEPQTLKSKIAACLRQYADEEEGKSSMRVSSVARAGMLRKAADVLDDEAALSGTREAVEPVAWQLVYTDGVSMAVYPKDEADRYLASSNNVIGVRPLYAAPPSDPVGQGTVTVARSDVEFLLQMAEQHSGVIAKRVAKSVRSALSPAPEAGSDEVERLRAERERLALAICGGEDAPGYANAQTVETLERVARDSNSLHMRTLDEAAALRDQLGKMRADAIEAVNQVVAERQAGLHGKRSDFNKGAVDGLQHGLARLRATLAETQEAGR